MSDTLTKHWRAMKGFMVILLITAFVMGTVALLFRWPWLLAFVFLTFVYSVIYTIVNDPNYEWGNW